MSLTGSVKMLAGSVNSLTRRSVSVIDDTDYFELDDLDMSVIPPIHKGWVKKKHPRNKKKLQRRWLALYEDRIHYCREEGGPPLGVIGLQHSRAEIYQGQRNMFEVCFDDMHRRRYQFVTNPDVDRAVWVWKINCCSYLKYGTTRKHLTTWTVSYLNETMGIDKIKKLWTSKSYTAASEHFLYEAGEGSPTPERVGTVERVVTDGRVGTEHVGTFRKESSLDSEVSTSSEERWRSTRLSEADSLCSNSQYVNIPPSVDSDGYRVELEEVGEFQSSDEEEEEDPNEELYFCPITGKESRDFGEDYLIAEITEIKKREKQVFVPTELSASKGNFTHEVKEDEPDYLQHCDIGGIFETLESLNCKAEQMEKDGLADHDKDPYLTSNDITVTAPPLPPRHGGGLGFLTNAIKKFAGDGRRKSDVEIVGANTVATQCCSVITDDVIKVRCAGVKDFIEVELKDIGTTYTSLIECFAEEFGLTSDDILMVRKLPDVWIRPCGKDVKRIIARQEFELELRR